MRGMVAAVLIVAMSGSTGCGPLLVPPAVGAGIGAASDLGKRPKTIGVSDVAQIAIDTDVTVVHSDGRRTRGRWMGIERSASCSAVAFRLLVEKTQRTVSLPVAEVATVEVEPGHSGMRDGLLVGLLLDGLFVFMLSQANWD